MLNIRVARIFDLEGGQTTNHMQWRHQKFFKRGNFCGTKISYNGNRTCSGPFERSRLLRFERQIEKMKLFNPPSALSLSSKHVKNHAFWVKFRK